MWVFLLDAGYFCWEGAFQRPTNRTNSRIRTVLQAKFCKYLIFSCLQISIDKSVGLLDCWTKKNEEEERKTQKLGMLRKKNSI
ncbi:hypothetical protein CLI78_02165 [Porphyromonas gingivalis]|nr:hypothetical protein CLI78_02165 [Porphyromonas gingivalis]